MPRMNPLRTLANQDNLAERIAFERSERGWTYDGLAKRMTDAGYPIQRSAIFKIETAGRRIDVDELVGFSTAFGIDIDDLLLPMSVVGDREAQAALEKQAGAVVALGDAVIAAWDARKALMEYLAADPTRAERVFQLRLESIASTFREAAERSKAEPKVDAVEAMQAAAARVEAGEMNMPGVPARVAKAFGVLLEAIDEEGALGHPAA